MLTANPVPSSSIEKHPNMRRLVKRQMSFVFNTGWAISAVMATLHSTMLHPITLKVIAEHLMNAYTT
jgi:hypothetical protein